MTREIKLSSFKFSKIAVERTESFDGELKIKPNINIKNIEKHKSDTSKQESLKIEFKFDVDYNGLGSVALEGKFHILTDDKTIKEAVSSWKDKKVDNDLNLLLVNVIMQKCSVKALQLEEDIGLPYHIQLPKLQFGKK